MTKRATPPTNPPRDEEAFRAAVAAGIAAAHAGRTIDYERVRAWLLSWGKPGELPRPK